MGANKPLHTTPDGANSSASRSTLSGPACVSSGVRPLGHSMTRQEFIECRDRYRRTVAPWGLVALCVFVGTIALMAHIEPKCESWPTPIWLGMNVGAVALMVGAVSTAVIKEARLARRLGISCPHCRRRLTMMMALVVASGRCGNCGAKVLDDAA